MSLSTSLICIPGTRCVEGRDGPREGRERGTHLPFTLYCVILKMVSPLPRGQGVTAPLNR